jgi:methylated-DNA-[protein]-cysteine S-methyltransferase
MRKKIDVAKGADREEIVAAAPLELTLCWRGDRIAALRLRLADKDVLAGDASPEARGVQAALKRLTAGRPAEFPDLPLDWDALPAFTRRVLEALKDKVGHGFVTTYGGLARLAGEPGKARAVGQAMARNPWPLVVPCHRVVGSTGALTGYTNPCGLDLKALLLRLEGGRAG